MEAKISVNFPRFYAFPIFFTFKKNTNTNSSAKKKTKFKKTGTGPRFDLLKRSFEVTTISPHERVLDRLLLLRKPNETEEGQQKSIETCNNELRTNCRNFSPSCARTLNNFLSIYRSLDQASSRGLCEWPGRSAPSDSTTVCNSV